MTTVASAVLFRSKSKGIGSNANERLNPVLPRLGRGRGEEGVKYTPLLFFLHHPKTAQGIKLKLSDFKDTHLRHILQVKPVRQNFKLLPWQQNYRRYLAGFDSTEK